MSRQSAVDDMNRKFHRFVQSATDVCDHVTDDVIVGDDAPQICCGDGDARFSGESDVTHRDATVSKATEQWSNDQQLDASVGRREPPTDDRSLPSNAGAADVDRNASSVVVTCSASDTLGISKRTVECRDIGVTETTIDCRALGLVETTVTLDGCRLVRTTLDCRSLDVTETRLYSQELGVLTTTIRHGSSTPPNYPHLLATDHNHTHKVSSSNDNVWTAAFGQGTSCSLTTQAETERKSHADKPEAVSNVDEVCLRCCRVQRMANSECLFNVGDRGYTWSDDSGCKCGSSGRCGEKGRHRSSWPAVRYCTSSEQPTDQSVTLGHLTESRDEQVPDDHWLTSVTSLKDSVQDTAAVQLSDVIDMSPLPSDDDILVVDSVSDDAEEDLLIQDDIISGDCSNEFPGVRIVDVSSVSTDDIELQRFAVAADECSPQRDVFDVVKEDEDDDAVELPQQQLSSTENEFVDDTTRNETKQSKLQREMTLNVATVEELQTTGGSRHRFALKPCQVLLRRLRTSSVVHLVQDLTTNVYELPTDATTVIDKQGSLQSTADGEPLGDNLVALGYDTATSNVLSLYERNRQTLLGEASKSQEVVAEDSMNETTASCTERHRAVEVNDARKPRDSCEREVAATGDRRTLERNCKSVTSQDNDKFGGTKRCNLIPAAGVSQPSSKRKVRHDSAPQQNFACNSALSVSSDRPTKHSCHAGGFRSPAEQKHTKKQESCVEKTYGASRAKKQESRHGAKSSCHSDSLEETSAVNSVTGNKRWECNISNIARHMKRKRKGKDTVQEIGKKKMKSKATEKMENITWKITSLAEQTVQESKNVDIDRESVVSSAYSSTAAETVSPQDEAVWCSQSMTICRSDDVAVETAQQPRAPLVVRLRRQTPFNSAVTSSSSSPCSDVMAQVIAEIRRVHRRLDVVLLRRRRRRHGNASSTDTWTGALPSADARHSVVTTLGHQPLINTSADSNQTRHVDDAGDQLTDRPVGMTSEDATWPIRLVTTPRQSSSAVVRELLLSATQQRPLDVNRLLALMISSPLVLRTTSSPNTSVTLMLTTEAALAGAVTRQSLTALPTPVGISRQKRQRRRRSEQRRSVVQPLGQQEGLSTTDCTVAVARNDGEQRTRELSNVEDVRESSIPSTTSVRTGLAQDGTTVATNTATNTPQLSRTGDSSVECLHSTESSASSTHLQLRATSSEELRTRRMSPFVAPVHRQSSMNAEESRSTVLRDRQTRVEQRPKSVGVSRSSTPRRPGWLRSTTPGLLDGWQTPLDYMHRPLSTPSVPPPAAATVLRHHASPYQLTTDQSAVPLRSRDPGASRFLPTLSLFDTELDLSDCDVTSQADDRETSQYDTAAAQQRFAGTAARYREDWIESLFVEFDQSHDRRTTNEPRDYGLSQNPFYATDWPANNCGQRLYRPAARPCSWWWPENYGDVPRSVSRGDVLSARPSSCWYAESDMSTAAPTAHCYNIWSPCPWPHNHYRRHHQHHHH